jgi:purine-binding chemotaxis protein CheW
MRSPRNRSRLMTTQTQTETATQTAVEDRAGKYLTFCLDDEEYGLEILTVREIIGIMPITSVPKTPEFIKGVINLRGKVIPVIDLRLKFNMPEAERTDETCIIVVQVEKVEVGIVVDRVSEVRDINGKEIDDPPSFGTDVDASFILGMGKTEDRVTILLDINKVLGSDHDDLASLAQ